MKTILVNSKNQICHVLAATISSDDVDTFCDNSVDELYWHSAESLMSLPGAELTVIYNSLQAEDRQVKKFADKKSAIARIVQAIDAEDAVEMLPVVKPKVGAPVVEKTKADKPKVIKTSKVTAGAARRILMIEALKLEKLSTSALATKFDVSTKSIGSDLFVIRKSGNLIESHRAADGAVRAAKVYSYQEVKVDA